MANENPSWGEERIANELLLKLGVRVSPRTIRKYLPPRPPRQPRGDLRWATFLRLHAHEIIACDFLVVVTARFRLLYVLVVIEHRSRRLVHCNVTAHPTAAWTMQQLREAVGLESRYEYLLHDRDSIFAEQLDESISKARYQGIEIPTPLPDGQCDLRTSHRHDSTRVPELVDTAVRITLAIHSEIVDSALQHWASAHGLGPRCS